MQTHNYLALTKFKLFKEEQNTTHKYTPSKIETDYLSKSSICYTIIMKSSLLKIYSDIYSQTKLNWLIVKKCVELFKNQTKPL